MQFTGQPLITATKFEREALRCAKCQQRYVAPLPEGVNEERYDATCDATIALMRYGGGLPWHRQAGVEGKGGKAPGGGKEWGSGGGRGGGSEGKFLGAKGPAGGGGGGR